MPNEDSIKLERVSRETLLQGLRRMIEANERKATEKGSFSALDHPTDRPRRTLFEAPSNVVAFRGRTENDDLSSQADPDDTS